MLQVHVQREKSSLGQQFRRIAVPVEFRGTDFPGGGQILDRRFDDRKNAFVKKPGDGGGGEQRDDELHEQQPAQPGMGKCRHAARRERLPGES